MFLSNTIVKSFRKFASAFFDRPIRKISSDIGIHSTATGCSLQMSVAGRSISCLVACKAGDEPLTESVSVSSDFLEQLAQSTGDVEFGPVESTENGSRFTVGWHTGAAIRYVELDVLEPQDFSDASVPLSNIDERFLPCLAHAFKVVDATSTRYSLGCVQLNGRDGTMAATDGSQTLLFDGFEFPWKSEAILIRKIRLFALKSFMNLRDVTVGLQDKAIVIASGQWRFTFPVEMDARFPKVDRVIPKTQAVLA